jgi:methylated-DNA-protein-cysteine methyltransferase-like protein
MTRRSEVTVYDKIYALVRKVPRGRVATYGQIARLLDRCTPRMVGYAMAAVPGDSDVPWHRIINSQGQVSPRSAGDGSLAQRAILESEGVVFDSKGRVDLEKVGWREPRKRSSRR